jgi:S-adenosylmethionine hydrolase
LNRPEFWLPGVSRTFHGRDIFAPVSAHLAWGLRPEQLGSPIGDPVCWPLIRPIRHPDGHITGQVVYADHFGNLITNVPGEWIAGGRWQVRAGGNRINGISATYADAERGALLALVGSGGTLEIAVREGNAVERLGGGVGERVELWPEYRAASR